jgi:hypothetical protein
MRFAWLAIAFPVSLVAGCSHFYPLPVPEPCIEKEGKTCKQSTEREKNPRPDPAKNFDEVKTLLKAYAEHYDDQADLLRKRMYQMSDAALGGGLLGILGGLTKSADTAIAGGVIAAGAAIPPSRYNLQTQAENYEKASESMYCMYKEATTSELTDQEKTALRPHEFNDRIDRVRRRLRKIQSEIIPSGPDLAALKKSLEDQIQKERDAVAAKNKDVSSLATRKAITDELRSKLETCVISFGG